MNEHRRSSDKPRSFSDWVKLIGTSIAAFTAITSATGYVIWKLWAVDMVRSEIRAETTMYADTADVNQAINDMGKKILKAFDEQCRRQERHNEYVRFFLRQSVGTEMAREIDRDFSTMNRSISGNPR
jgi:hypothetical protein